MSQFLTKLELLNAITLNPKFSWQRGLFAFCSASLFCVVGLYYAVQASVWLGVCAFIILPVFVWLFSRSAINTGVYAIQKRSPGYWMVTLQNGQKVLTQECQKPFKCTWCCILYLRVVSTQKKLLLIVHKDSIPLEKFQLLLYLLN